MERAKMRGATVLERIDNEEVYKRFNYKCCNCGINTPLDYKGLCMPNSPEMDHVIPLCKGGQHTWDNVQLLCRRCNQNKGDSNGTDKDISQRATISIGDLIEGNAIINQALKERFM